MVRRSAHDILEQHWNRELPVDVKAIARSLGLKLIKDDQLASKDLSGQLSYDHEIATIRYNFFDPQVRQRFTIAHEIGHFVLNHGDSFRDSPAEFSLAQHDYREIAANRFAAELLMPESAIDRAIIRDNIVRLDELARLFEVSEVAMKFRLKNTGWLD